MSSVETGTALQLLRAKQNAYYIQAVQDALQAEEQRKQKLQKVLSKQEATRLEKQFIRERSADRERLRHIQEDHALLLNAKIAEWKATGGLVKLAPDENAIRKSTERRVQRKEKRSKVKFTKESLDRLAVPRASTAKTEDTDDCPTTSNSRGTAETTQELEFYKNVYRKQDRARLARNSSSSLLTLTASNLQTMSETELLRKKANLLSELHGVVSLEARIIQDDQCTIHSSVSSWKSSDYRPSR
ncbi:hypothetical protein PC116_g5778 [Phytophthora cactorum]|uniref:Uncharacterized protein n=1 Tax=Phytophthora cactorum TaxID=29920 RepID=A0A329SFW8_9STRA|nr:hypothetical protein Pcac1_g16242 [Phytophthora cactorum]KAG2830516.1 hypothetical protein PC111_g7363 [Phytophthora cactorum]KAG2836830.1 hypothetical protein PC112_g5135 [Phytophthora cactorum]KAG2859645.1 hypothetical protein PC113_g8743 [Phytophthora cactorum]KAG2911883.1 hypothetical protein PC114_g9179 [Phytophthora cactorum]